MAVKTVGRSLWDIELMSGRLPPPVDSPKSVGSKSEVRLQPRGVFGWLH